MADRLPGDVAKEVLLLEQSGDLPDHAQRDLDAMRAAGLAPPALPKGVRPTPEPLTFRQELDVAGKGLGAFATETARTGALPTIGGVAGATLGGALTLPFGGSGALVGESVGSMLGEGANQLFGITDPSLTQIGLAGAGGPVLRGVQRAYRGLRPSIARKLPGAAPELHEIAQETLEGIAPQIRPGNTDALWTRVDTLGRGQRVVSTHLDNAAQELKRIYGKSPLADPADQKVIDKVLSWTNRHLNDVPFDEMEALRKDIGHLVRSTDDRTSSIGARLYAAIEDDYDAFGSMRNRPQQLVEKLREARAATKSDLVAERVDRLVRPGVAGGSDMGPVVRPGAVGRKLRQDPFLYPPGKPKRITDDQIDLIEGALQKIKGLPARPPDPGVQFGSGVRLGHVVGGAALGGLTGDPAQMAVVGGLGLAVPWMIAKIVATDAGQRAVRRMVEGTGKQIDPRIIVGMYNAYVSKRPDVPEGTRVKLGDTR